MRPRTLLLSLSALFAFLYPLVLLQKERIFSSASIMEGMASWFWIAEPLSLMLFFFACAAVMRQKILCYASIIAASFCLAFVAAEAYFSLPSLDAASNLDSAKIESRSSVYVKSGQATHIYEKDYFAPDPVLGYGPNPNGKMRVASRREKGDEVIYDVLYSIDEKGRRFTPDRGDKADAAILLFGCSFTFGEGLNDRETFAWRLGEMLGEKFQVFNYGFHGYGAHQMLALAESGRLDALGQRYKQIYALYLTIRGHELRCVGLSPWDQSGPRYILENGAIKHDGKFSGGATADALFPRFRAYEQIKQKLIAAFAMHTHVAIIAQSMRELAARYNAHALTVIWPDFTRIEPMLRDRGVRILPLADALPDYASERAKYAIKGDGHPNALANTRIAEALAAYIQRHPYAAETKQLDGAAGQ